MLSALRDGTLAVGRVVWADTDDDLDAALVNLLGAAAGKGFAEPPSTGWPSLGGDFPGLPGSQNAANARAPDPLAASSAAAAMSAMSAMSAQRDLLTLLGRGSAAPMMPPGLVAPGGPPGLNNLESIFGGGGPGAVGAGPGASTAGLQSMPGHQQRMAAPPPGFGASTVVNPFDRVSTPAQQHQQPHQRPRTQFPPPPQQLGGQPVGPPGLDGMFRQLSFGSGSAEINQPPPPLNAFDGGPVQMNPTQHGGVNDAAQMQNGVRALRRPQPGDGAYVAAAPPEANGTGGGGGDRGGRRNRGRGGNGGVNGGGGKGGKGKGAAPPPPVSTGPKTLPKPRAVPPKA